MRVCRYLQALATFTMMTSVASAASVLLQNASSTTVAFNIRYPGRADEGKVSRDVGEGKFMPVGPTATSRTAPVWKEQTFQRGRIQVHLFRDAKTTGQTPIDTMALGCTLRVPGLNPKPTTDPRKMPPEPEAKSESSAMLESLPLPRIARVEAITPAAIIAIARVSRLWEAPPNSTIADTGTKRSRREQAIHMVIQSITRRSTELSKLPLRPDKPGDPVRPVGDALTADLIRTAAASADSVEANHRAAAFLVALGIALDDSSLLRTNPLTKSLCTAVETDDERKVRLSVLGSPTLRDRRDLCQHFAVSMSLTVLISPAGAELAGITKELLDMRTASGFSFVDLAADYAGIELARALIADLKQLEAIATAFTTDNYFPKIRGLREGLNADQFREAYGSTDDRKFTDETARIRKLIRDLPAYQKPQK